MFFIKKTIIIVRLTESNSQSCEFVCVCHRLFPHGCHGPLLAFPQIITDLDRPALLVFTGHPQLPFHS